MKYDLWRTYLSYIRNAVGSKLFRSFYVFEPGDDGTPAARSVDILEKGRLSCASAVSNILHMLRMVGTPVARVESLVKMLEDSDRWESVVDLSRLQPGDVVVWSKNELGHKHAGFFMGVDKKTGDEMAVSTSWKKEKIVEHPLREGGSDANTKGKKNSKGYRNIEKAFRWMDWER